VEPHKSPSLPEAGGKHFAQAVVLAAIWPKLGTDYLQVRWYGRSALDLRPPRETLP